MSDKIGRDRVAEDGARVAGVGHHDLRLRLSLCIYMYIWLSVFLSMYLSIYIYI